MLVKRIKPHSILENATVNSISKRNSSLNVLRGRRLGHAFGKQRKILARCGWGLTVLLLWYSAAHLDSGVRVTQKMKEALEKRVSQENVPFPTRVIAHPLSERGLSSTGPHWREPFEGSCIKVGDLETITCSIAPMRPNL